MGCWTLSGSRAASVAEVPPLITPADGSADGEQFAVAIVNVSNVDQLREVSLA